MSISERRLTGAADGLRNALARGQRKPAASAPATPARAAGAAFKAKAAVPDNSPRGRIAALARAVDADPACKGKAMGALALLADDDLAGVPGRGLVKLLRSMPADGAESAAALAAIAARPATAKAKAEAGGAAVWGKVLAGMVPGVGR